MATKTRRSERESKPRPKSDAYTGLLVISLLALITACVLWYVDFDSYGKNPPPKTQGLVPAAGSSTANAPAIPTAPPASETPATPPAETQPAPMPMDTPMPMPPMGDAPMPPKGDSPMPPKGDSPMPPKVDMPMPPKGPVAPAQPTAPKGM